MPIEALKAQISVSAGVILGIGMREYYKEWNYTSSDYEADRTIPQDQPTKFSKMLDEAHEYAKGLSNPAYVNWTRVEWIWV